MKAWKVKVEITPWLEGGYSAEVPYLQGCWIVSPTVEEAIRDIYEVIEMSIASRIRHGEALPPELEELRPGSEGTIKLDVAVAVP